RSVRLVVLVGLAIDQIAQSGLSSLSVIYYSAQLFNTGTHKGNRQITRTDQPGNKRSVEYIQPLEYHAVLLLVLYALFFTMIYR
ncbi:hypothetical protein, partial [Klebsiella pneumoniae]